MHLLHLHRVNAGDLGFQTLGELRLYKNYEVVGEWVTVEPPWKDNMRDISCIPNGQYLVKHRTSDRFGKHLLVCNVPGRSLILFHAGNFRGDSRGCILPGKQFIDIDKDGHQDVTQSRLTMGELVTEVPNKTPLLVTSEFPL